MKRTIAIGAQDFEKIRAQGVFYVDKTDFIRRWWTSMDDVTLITRPRRFGKTLNMSMLNCFFSNSYANRSDLFEGLKIWEDEELRKEQGLWPVISLSFADVKFPTISETQEMLNQLIADEYNRYSWMIREPVFTDADREFFGSVNRSMPRNTASVSLKKLSEWLFRFYGKKVIILIDEYDTPMQEAYMNGYWDEMTAWLRPLLNSTLKSNPFMQRGILTGITRVSKESVFSDLSNLKVVTTTSNLYADCFGFTEEEVFAALEEQGYGEKQKKEVREWYDGFTFGAVKDIYNPWSVTCYLEEGILKCYWANTSSNGLVGTLLRRADPEIKQQFEILMRGESIEVQVDEQLVFKHLDEDPAAIWSLLLASGYLRVDNTPVFRETSLWSNPIYRLQITNFETRRTFADLIVGWFGSVNAFSAFVSDMEKGDAERMEAYLNRIMENCISSFDRGKSNPENFYHGLVLGLLVVQDTRYHLRSNRESGDGRYDVMMEPRQKSLPGIILEFKVSRKMNGEKSLLDTARNALNQIEEKRYDAELIARGFPKETILKYGLAFQGRRCRILKGQ